MPGTAEGAERPTGGAVGARSAVNLALGLHGLAEAFSLSFVLDEEACNAEVRLGRGGLGEARWIFALFAYC